MLYKSAFSYLCKEGLVPLGQQSAECAADGTWEFTPCQTPGIMFSLAKGQVQTCFVVRCQPSVTIKCTQTLSQLCSDLFRFINPEKKEILRADKITIYCNKNCHIVWMHNCNQSLKSVPKGFCWCCPYWACTLSIKKGFEWVVNLFEKSFAPSRLLFN